MPNPVIETLQGMRSLLLALLWVAVSCFLLYTGLTLVAIVLIAIGCAVLIWWSTHYRRILVTIHRKWHSIQKLGPAGTGAYAKAREGRHEFHLATSHGEAIVTKSVYDRVDEGKAITVIGNVANGTIHVIWPLL